MIKVVGRSRQGVGFRLAARVGVGGGCCMRELLQDCSVVLLVEGR